jgi:sarcosine oxidase subunit gamma
MRLVPLDLRAQSFPPGTCTRSALNHMGLIIVREADGFLLLVFRSMAETAWHELETALQALHARETL